MSDLPVGPAEWRRHRGYSQREAAEAVGVWPSTIQRFEAGQFTPRGETLRRLAAFYKCSVDDLLQRRD